MRFGRLHNVNFAPIGRAMLGKTLDSKSAASFPGSHGRCEFERTNVISYNAEVVRQKVLAPTTTQGWEQGFSA